MLSDVPCMSNILQKFRLWNRLYVLVFVFVFRLIILLLTDFNSAEKSTNIISFNTVRDIAIRDLIQQE